MTGIRLELYPTYTSPYKGEEAASHFRSSDIRPGYNLLLIDCESPTLVFSLPRRGIPG